MLGHSLINYNQPSIECHRCSNYGPSTACGKMECQYCFHCEACCLLGACTPTSPYGMINLSSQEHAPPEHVPSSLYYLSMSEESTIVNVDPIALREELNRDRIIIANENAELNRLLLHELAQNELDNTGHDYNMTNSVESHRSAVTFADNNDVLEFENLTNDIITYHEQGSPPSQEDFGNIGGNFLENDPSDDAYSYDENHDNIKGARAIIDGIGSRSAKCIMYSYYM